MVNELALEDALFRIKDLYDRTEGKCVISFSGGKDSTVVAELYFIAKERGMVGHIPLVFADTKVEYQAINDFVKWFSENKQEVIYLKPPKPFGQIIKEYGKPAMSKVKSDFLSTYQKALEKGKDPLKGKRTSEMISGYQMDHNFEPKTKDGKKLATRQRLADKHMHFLHPDIEYKINSKCCDYLKKMPFDKYYKENGVKGFITGMRVDEGGIRAEMYKSCTAHKTIGSGKNKVKLVHKMPIFDWNEDDVEDFINSHNIKISRAYTEYGLDRTGCIGCPFAKDIHTNLKVLYENEPNKYKAVQHWLGEVYKDLMVELPFDPKYTQELIERKPIVEQRRLEMIKKYRGDKLDKWEKRKSKEKPTLFDLK